MALMFPSYVSELCAGVTSSKVSCLMQLVSHVLILDCITFQALIDFVL